MILLLNPFCGKFVYKYHVKELLDLPFALLATFRFFLLIFPSIWSPLETPFIRRLETPFVTVETPFSTWLPGNATSGVAKAISPSYNLKKSLIFKKFYVYTIEQLLLM